MWRALLTVLVLSACSGEAPGAPTPTAPTPTPPPTAPSAPTPAVVEAAPVAAPVPIVMLPEVELLHAVPTRVAVSSAYRDDAEQVAKLVDGDLETAWNSRTGDLVGAWIEVELPPDVTVRAIAMTPGYTHVSPRADLFPGNHRVSLVRVSRDGAALGEHGLDVERREPIEIPVNAGGGRYRIEVLATVPGTRTDWQEICVSELRVLGTSPTARAGAATPSTSIGTLAGLPATPTPAEAAVAPEGIDDEGEDAIDDEAELLRVTIEEYEELLSDWVVYLTGVWPYLDGDDLDMDDTTRAARDRTADERARYFARAEELLRDVRPAAVTAVHARASGFAPLWAGHVADLDALLDGYAALIDDVCHAAEGRVRFRAQAARAIVDTYAISVDTDLEGGYDEHGRRLSAARRAELREVRGSAQAFVAWLDGLGVEEWESLPATARRSLAEGTLVPPSEVAADWQGVRSELERADRACAR